MKNTDFQKLVTSIKEAGRIKRGEIKPSRVFAFTPLKVKSSEGGWASRKPNSPG
jgi:hypothetical protein